MIDLLMLAAIGLAFVTARGVPNSTVRDGT
jgi:hypothetical protein